MARHLRKMMKQPLLILGLLAAALVMVWQSLAFASQPLVRLKDIADIEGVRENVLVGYGLVVGLNGTGDSANSIPFTKQSLINMLGQLGVNAQEAADQLSMNNVAAVMVTANMPTFARQGSKLDVTVSSLGDSKSLEGGILIATPLQAANGEVYALAQGTLVVGGFVSEGGAGTVEKNHPTVARVSNGATVEQETGFELSDLGNELTLMLKQPDFTTALRVRNAINQYFRGEYSKATDHQTIVVQVPEVLHDDLVRAIHHIENLRVRPDESARVVVDEKTGTIVMGQDVRLSSVAISHSNLTIRVNESGRVAQASTFNLNDLESDVFALPDSGFEIGEGDGHFQIMENATTLDELVRGLNALGVTPRDVVSILQNLKAAGALQADLVVM